MTTRLPSTGAAPFEAPAATCRSDEVVVVHRLFKRLFADAPDIVRGVEVGDTVRAKRVAKHLHGITKLLHVHHRTEDAYFWDTMTDRTPSCGLHVALMRTQHERVSDLLDVVDERIDEWTPDADLASAERLALELEEVNQLLLVHLADEEREAFPILDEILTDAEWDRVHRKAQGHLPPLPLFVLVGFMLESVPPAERDHWFATQMPAPIRVAYRAVGRKQYEHALAGLFPERAQRTRRSTPRPPRGIRPLTPRTA
ncbi:hemerythrin domain-containing protein [Agromyces protaetiae]|uniref:Hemerythrin domain-containing protein n=1 Tax=Agromyces protaetiae TaxID=2509455 RepID=A0A4P6FDQ2_9MICO|nr:hemerythrin domain-containing protein [Agromyces protaetiae]QAY73896.1 hemerythrin domain-containing protein [Agromyces protaetiae]